MNSDLILYNIYFRKNEKSKFVFDPNDSFYELQEDIIFIFETNKGLMFFAELPSRDIFSDFHFTKTYPIYDLEKIDFTNWKKIEPRTIEKIIEILDNDPFIHVLFKCRGETSLFIYAEQDTKDNRFRFHLKEISEMEQDIILQNSFKRRDVKIPNVW